MASDDASRLQYILWWIASIAVSVLCCAALFVLFASALVDVRADIRDTNMRINAAEERQNRILAEIMIMRKRMATAAVPAAVVAPPAGNQAPAAVPPAGITLTAPAKK